MPVDPAEGGKLNVADGLPRPVISRFASAARPRLVGIVVIRQSPCETSGMRDHPRGAGRVQRVLVQPHHRRVHRHRPVQLPSGVRRGQHLGQEASQVPSVAPPVMTLPHRLPRTEDRRQVTPRDPRPIPVDPFHHLPVTPERPPTPPLRRRKRLDPLPHTVTEHRSPTHRSTLSDEPPRLGRHALVVPSCCTTSCSSPPVRQWLVVAGDAGCGSPGHNAHLPQVTR